MSGPEIKATMEKIARLVGLLPVALTSFADIPQREVSANCADPSAFGETETVVLPAVERAPEVRWQRFRTPVGGVRFTFDGPHSYHAAATTSDAPAAAPETP